MHACGRRLSRALAASRPAAAAAAAGASAARRSGSSKALAALARSRSRSRSQFAVRAMSSSRFQSLADDEDEGKRKRKGGDDEDGEDGEEGEEGGELAAEGEDGEAAEEDGDLELEEDIIDINKGGVDMDEELDEEVMRLFMANPLKWTPEKIARRFHLSKPRVEAIIFLKGEEAGLTPEEFSAKVAAAKEQAKQEMEAHAKLVEAAKAKGDEKELRRLLKRERQQDSPSGDFEVYEEEGDEEIELDEHERALLFGLDEDAYRNPDFFFLSDEFEGFPPLVRRLGKHGSTDQLHPAEAKELQRLAANNKVAIQKSFANPENATKPSKFKLAVKDISKKKKPLYVRDETRELRLASDAEVLRRTWVRRPPFFGGLDA
jgi:hypothetical protein